MALEVGYDVVDLDDCCVCDFETQKTAFAGLLPNKLPVGTTICVRGKLLPKCLRFSINLSSGRGPAANIAFHFNPRLDQRYVVRNCRIASVWGTEETTSQFPFSFRQRESFTVDILIGPDEFMVAVNGRHFCAFGYRVPVKQITDIEIHGPVYIHNVDFRNVKMYPDKKQLLDDNYAIPFNVDLEDFLADPPQLPVPFTGSLGKGFKIGWQLEIQGRVKILPHSFYINLQCGSQVWPHPVIPLHLNPRFSSAVGANSFVRNCWRDGRWQSEERCPTFPFTPGSPFTIILRRDAFDRFSVWVDSRLTGEYSTTTGSTIDVDHLDTVYIQGDIVLKYVVMRDRNRSVRFGSSKSKIVMSYMIPS